MTRFERKNTFVFLYVLENRTEIDDTFPRLTGSQSSQQKNLGETDEALKIAPQIFIPAGQRQCLQVHLK